MYYLLFISEQAMRQNTDIFFQEFTHTSEMNHTKKVSEDLNIFTPKRPYGISVYCDPKHTA